MRKKCACLKNGEYHTISEMLGCLAFERRSGEDKIMVIVNRNEHPIDYYLPSEWHNAETIFGSGMQGQKAELDALGAIILKKES